MPEFSDARYEKSRQSVNPETQGDFAEKAKASVNTVIKNATEIGQSINIKFDASELRVQMERDIKGILDNPAVPEIAKQKFLRDIELNANFFTSEITSDKVISYTKQREEDSFGMTKGETLGQNFTRLVYANFVAYIQGASTGLMHGFSEERYRTSSGVEYRRGSMDVFSSELRALDKEYGIDIASKIRSQEKESKTFARGDLARENLYRQTMVGLVKDYMRTQRAPQDGQRIISLIQTGSLTTRAKFGEKTQVDTPKGKVDIVDIVLAYKNSIIGFQGREHEARDAQSIALSDGISSKVKSVLGVDQLRSEFDHISVAATRDRMQHSSIADIVIMAKHLSQLIPIAGDALGVYMDSRDAKSGVSSIDGKFLSMNERAITAIFAVLGLVGVGAIANRIRKGVKMTEVIQSLWEAMKWLPAKLDAYVASGKTLTPGAIDIFNQLANTTRGKIGQNIQEALDRFTSTSNKIRDGGVIKDIPSGNLPIALERISHLGTGENYAVHGTNGQSLLSAILKSDGRIVPGDQMEQLGILPTNGGSMGQSNMNREQVSTFYLGYNNGKRMSGAIDYAKKNFHITPENIDHTISETQKYKDTIIADGKGNKEFVSETHLITTLNRQLTILGKLKQYFASMTDAEKSDYGILSKIPVVIMGKRSESNIKAGGGMVNVGLGGLKGEELFTDLPIEIVAVPSEYVSYIQNRINTAGASQIVVISMQEAKEFDIVHEVIKQSGEKNIQRIREFIDWRGQHQGVPNFPYRITEQYDIFRVLSLAGDNNIVPGDIIDFIKWRKTKNQWTLGSDEEIRNSYTSYMQNR